MDVLKRLGHMLRPYRWHVAAALTLQLLVILSRLLSCLSFLLCLLFFVPVSSTLRFLSLPLHWVFFAFSFCHRSFH